MVCNKLDVDLIRCIPLRLCNCWQLYCFLEKNTRAKLEAKQSVSTERSVIHEKVSNTNWFVSVQNGGLVGTHQIIYRREVITWFLGSERRSECYFMCWIIKWGHRSNEQQTYQKQPESFPKTPRTKSHTCNRSYDSSSKYQEHVISTSPKVK